MCVIDVHIAPTETVLELLIISPLEIHLDTYHMLQPVRRLIAVVNERLIARSRGSVHFVRL